MYIENVQRRGPLPWAAQLFGPGSAGWFFTKSEPQLRSNKLYIFYINEKCFSNVETKQWLHCFGASYRGQIDFFVRTKKKKSSSVKLRPVFWRCCWCSWQWVQTEVIQVVSLLLHLLRSDRADDAYQTWWFLNTGAWSKKTQKNGTTAIPVVKSNQCRNQSDSDALDFHTVFALKKKVVKADKEGENCHRWQSLKDVKYFLRLRGRKVSPVTSSLRRFWHRRTAHFSDSET